MWLGKPVATSASLSLAVRETLTAVQAAEERLLMGLRTLEGVPLAELAPLPLSRLPDLEAAGFVRTADGRLFATAQGRPVLNRVIEELAS